MELNTILSLIGSVLGGGVIGAFISAYYTSKTEDKKTDIEATDRLISQWEKLLAPLQAKLATLEKDLEEARERELEYKHRISTLETQLILFESSHIDIPLATWMKDTNGKMVFLNRIYEDMFLVPIGKSMDDYIGNTDYDIWSKEVADAFNTFDKEIMRTKKAKKRIEPLDAGNGTLFYAEVLKYPRFTTNKRVIGISGIIMRTALTKEELE